jgi:hypothetical protein
MMAVAANESGAFFFSWPSREQLPSCIVRATIPLPD